MDLLEPMNEIFTGKGLVYCSKNGDFVCTIENNTKFIIREIQNGEFYASIDFEQFELGHVYLSDRYATIIFRKTPSPLLIDLKAGELLKIFPYQTCFSSISPDDKVLLIHSEKFINYFSLPSLERAVQLDSVEIPELVAFAANNTKIFVLTKDTKEVIYYDIILEKKYFTATNMLQDKKIVELRVSSDESFLMICSLECIYVFDLTDLQNGVNLKFKVDIEAIEKYLSLTKNDPKKEEFDSFGKVIKNYLTGFGCSTDNKTFYTTYYTYLVCFDAQTGELTRLFQSTLSANRIIKSFPSKISDAFVSLLDNGRLIVWNLSCINFKNVTFEDMNTFHEPITDCLIPNVSHLNAKNSNLIVTFSSLYPDAKIHDLKINCAAKSVLANSLMVDAVMDNLLTSSIKQITMDDFGRFCFVISDIEEFFGKRLPDEKDFLKRMCTLIDLNDSNRIIEKISFVIKKNSRFQISSKFIRRKVNANEEETYLLIKQVSCINDFDPYCALPLDWTEFETSMKLYGPISAKSGLKLYDEFKLEGEMLGDYSITRGFAFACLMQNCQKLYDKEQPGVIKAKRYEVNLNMYELFDSKVKSLKVQKFSLNEFLTIDDYGSKNVFLDLQVTYNDALLLVYSKEGAVDNSRQENSNRAKPGSTANVTTFEYDYSTFKFNRDIKTEKAAILYDVINNNVLKRFTTIFAKETNIEKLIVSNGNAFACDDRFDLFNVTESGNLIRNIERNNYKNLSLSIDHARFVFSGRYLIVSELDLQKVYVVRCYDSFRVATLKLKSKLTCLRVGEEDRTIVIGTQDGNVLALKLLVDLEKLEAIEYIKYYRQSRIKNRKETIPKAVQSLDEYYLNRESLKNDLKRVVHSASAHRQLKFKESQFVSNSTISIQNNIKSGRSSSASIKHSEFHGGVAKLHLTNVALGLKHSQSRACVIQ